MNEIEVGNIFVLIDDTPDEQGHILRKYLLVRIKKCKDGYAVLQEIN